MTQHDALHMTADPAVMRLAHPVRVMAAYPRIMEDMRQIIGPRTLNALTAALAERDVLTAAAVDAVTGLPEHRHLKQYLAAVNSLPGGTEMGNAFSFLLALRQHVAPAPYFRLDDELVHLLEHTDIASDIPVACLQPPYPRIYVEFGTRRDIGVALPNTETGWHTLEGACVEQGHHPNVGMSLYVMLTGSPVASPTRWTTRPMPCCCQ